MTAKRHPSGNGVELERAREALQMAANGARVAVVSGGDAGVFGMAAALFEAIEKGDAAWRELDVAVVPGMTALLAAAARAGAPRGHDFCVISLSDYLKPWPVIEKRLQAASAGDFVLAIYNPASKTRREQLAAALDALRKARGGGDGCHRGQIHRAGGGKCGCYHAGQARSAAGGHANIIDYRRARYAPHRTRRQYAVCVYAALL